MEIRVSKKNFYEMYKRTFMHIIEKDGCTIPIESNHHIDINGITCFLEENKKHYLFFNKYGQMMIQKETEDGVRENHILFDLKNLSSLSFLARSISEEINEKNNRYYNSIYIFNV